MEVASEVGKCWARSGARKKINEQAKTGMTSEPSGPAAPLT